MGNSQPPPANPCFVSASRSFAQHELEDLKSLFKSLAAQSQSNGRYISPSIFQAYFGLSGALGERMFNLVTLKRNDHKLTFEDLVVAKATYEKGTKDEIEEFIYQLLDVNDDGVLGRSDLESVVIAMLEIIFSMKISERGSNSHQDIVDVLLNAATFSKNGEGSSNKSMSFEDFRSWCTLIPSARKFLGGLLTPPDPGRPGCQVPRLLCSENVHSSMLLLRKEYAWHIGGALSPHELEEWKLLYHSAMNGLSFNTFLGSISNDEGSTVLIIKDKEGHIYGGYASQPWERHGDFYGDMKSFLFQLYPKLAIYRPTGANSNLQWCAANFSSESIPNGIGFGGRVNHFGLFLSASFDKGHTFTNTTFGNPCLSKTSQIYPEVIECWGVIKRAQQERQDALKGTVLERFKEDRHMLNMVGLANSSE
ncbi:TLD domain-containing protein 1 isoform X1 [Citrus clementina]|uniref:TLD domain-containing protein 1 isoform X1 n=1 Tax=Citrus clementina TaxID=85681 RepID=UPI000CED1148|nr:TLD domain-containing protein 1 isoform X1 [Citrus x clementina]